MTALPPSNTRRYFLDYVTCGEQHTLVMRTADTVSSDDASMKFATFLTAMSPAIYSLQVVRLRECVTGSNVSIPAEYTGTEEFGSGVGPRVAVPNTWSFTGKDASGRRVRIELFGRNVGLNDDYRLFGVDDTTIEATIAELESDGDYWKTIAGNVPFWNQYANEGVNAYWQRELRL